MVDTLWGITLGSWLTASVIILIRFLFCKALSPRAKYLLWLLLVLRLCLPVLPESRLSLQNFAVFDMASFPAVVMIQETPDNTSEAEHFVEPEEAMTAQTARPTITNQAPESANSTNVSVDIFCLLIWIIGTVLSFGIYAGMWLRTCWQLRMAVYVDDSETVRCFLNVRRALGVSRGIRLCYGQECLIGGLVRPTLLIPRELNGEQLEAALTHELMHYKSGDLWIAAIQRLLCCIYWFNPVVWICFRWARLDCEKACDQRVLELENVSPSVYAQLLFEESKQKMQVGTTAFGHGNIRSRIKSVVDFKKPAVWMTITSVLAACVILLFTLTGKASEKPWDWAERLDAADITAAYVLDGETKMPIDDSQVDDIVEMIHEIPQEIFMEFSSCGEPESSLVLVCGQETYQIGLVFDPQRQLVIELDGTLWGFDSSALAWEIKREVFQNDLSPASYPLSILLDIPEDSEILKSFKILQQDAIYDELFSLLDEKMGDYITERFMDYFAGSAGIGKLWANAALYDYTVFCEELKVTKNDSDTTNYDYSARLSITCADRSKQTIPVSGIVRCDDVYQVTSISCDSDALREFYQSLSGEAITVIPPTESQAPEVTVLPHADGEEPEVSTLPQEEWKPKILEIKDTLYRDYNATGDIYQSDATLVELLEAASDTSIVSLTLSGGDVVWRAPSADCARIAKQISASSSIVVDTESEYGYFYLRADETYGSLLEMLEQRILSEGNDQINIPTDMVVSTRTDGSVWAEMYYGNIDKITEEIYVFELELIDRSLAVVNMIKK